MEQPSKVDTAAFQDTVKDFYQAHARTMPWRQDTRPYYVLVSELMLQQTQVARVVPKFIAFVTAFPDVQTLSRASLSQVVTYWAGLGYNRRAQFLHASSRMIMDKYGGVIPDQRDLLTALPGVGPNTAGAIMAYAFNRPVVFIETNIRTVYLHHFFAGRQGVSDTEIAELLEATMDREHPREWYWGLMDYGTYLKATHGNNTARSKQYKKQSAFAGSLRQMRGEIIRCLSEKPYSFGQLERRVAGDKRLGPALHGLLRDGLVEQCGDTLRLTGDNELR